MSINQYSFKANAWYLYQWCIMTTPFISCQVWPWPCDHDHRKISHLNLENGTKCHIWVLKRLSWLNIHVLKNYPTLINQFDLCQGHSNNRHFQISVGFHLNRQKVLRPLGLGVLFQTCVHLRRIVQGIPRKRSLNAHFWILWVWVNFFSHYSNRIDKCP